MHAQKPTRNCPRGTALSAWVKDDEGQSCIQLYNLMDNGPLSLIHSLCGGAKAKSSAWDRSQSARTATEFPMGKVVFNKYLLDTDAFDQMSANRQGFYSTTFNMKTTRWPLRMFEAMVDIMVNNVWCIRREAFSLPAERRAHYSMVRDIARAFMELKSEDDLEGLISYQQDTRRRSSIGLPSAPTGHCRCWHHVLPRCQDRL